MTDIALPERLRKQFLHLLSFSLFIFGFSFST